MEYTEAEIRMATLVALNASQSGTLTTSDLILALEAFMRPRGKDAQIARDRNDTYFSQKVRNLISHRDAGTSLVARGLVQYDAEYETLTITAGGREACSF